MLDLEKSKTGNTTGNPGPENSFRRAARIGVFSLALGALVIVVGLGAAARVGAGNADDVGAQAFKSNCVVCHGADGTGTPTGKALKAPDLHSDAVQKMTKQQIEDQVSNGKNNMPPFKSTLSKDQISALADYVHSAFGKK